MPTLPELLAQREALEKQIAAMQTEERSRAIAEIRTIMASHGLTAADISSGTIPTKAMAAPRRVAPVKYRDQNGNTWSGRGLQPKWLVAAIAAGKKLEDFAV